MRRLELGFLQSYYLFPLCQTIRGEPGRSLSRPSVSGLRFHRFQIVEGQIEQKDIYAGLTQYTQLAAFGVITDQPPDLIFA